MNFQELMQLLLAKVSYLMTIHNRDTNAHGLNDIKSIINSQEISNVEQAIAEYKNSSKLLICIQLTNTNMSKAALFPTLNLRINDEDNGSYTYVPNREDYGGNPSIEWINDNCYFAIDASTSSNRFSIYLTTDSPPLYYLNSGYNPETDTTYPIVYIDFNQNQYMTISGEPYDITSNMIVIRYDVSSTFKNGQSDVTK